MRAVKLLGIVALVALAGCLGGEEVDPASQEGEDDPVAGNQTDANVVVAVIDSGINPYHEEFRAPDRWSEGEALPIDIDADPTPIELSFAAEDWESALEEDQEELASMEAETLYTFPGTKIIGGISFTSTGEDTPPVVDFGGHGTMTASRATGNTVSIGQDDPGIWVVAVQGFTPAAMDWAASQDWIDVISISSGMSAGGLVPAAANVEAQEAIQAFHEASHEKPLFASSGNGVANVGMAGFPSWLRGASGAPDAFSVGAVDNDNLAQWDNQDSYIAADGCANPAAEHNSMDAVTNSGGGTSSATPFSAGGAATLVLEARRTLGDAEIGPRVDEDRQRPEGAWDSGYDGDANVVLAEGEAPEGLEDGPLADGVLTMRELKDVLYHTALVTPTDDESDGEECGPHENGNPFGAGYVPGDALAEQARFPFQGYGEVNVASIESALAVLDGEDTLPQRPVDDQHYQRAHSHKKTFVVGEPTLPAAP